MSVSSIPAAGRVLAALPVLVACSASLLAEEVVNLETPKRPWGTEQVLGEPDAMPGDSTQAWASLNADEREWLILGYQEAVIPKTVAIHENYSPGAVDKVTVFDPDGNEVVAWEGEDPTPQGSESGVSVIPLRVDFEVQRLKIYIDSESVADWNEIDAVGLTSETGDVQWAVEAEASSTYAGISSVVTTEPFVVYEVNRLEQVASDIAEIREEIERLKAIQEDLREIKELLQNR